MKKLLNDLENLRKSEIKSTIDKQLKSFKELGKKSNKEIFKELCFCLLTAGFQAERSIKIQQNIGNRVCSMSEIELAQSLRELGHRFPNARAAYIREAQQHMKSLKQNVNKEDKEAREWLVQNVKGLGMKEASHFLRNIGYENLAIIDFHIIDLLVKHGIIQRPKALTSARYKEVENVLKDLGNKVNMNMSELDLYLWYMETGKVLK